MRNDDGENVNDVLIISSDDLQIGVFPKTDWFVMTSNTKQRIQRESGYIENALK